jgi:hypothetical protein
MSIKVLRVVLDDINYPHLSCEVTSDNYAVGRESVYDTAFPNFEVLLTNALRVKLREMLEDRKNGDEDVQRQFREYLTEKAKGTVPPHQPADPKVKERGPKKVEGKKKKAARKRP